MSVSLLEHAFYTLLQKSFVTIVRNNDTKGVCIFSKLITELFAMAELFLINNIKQNQRNFRNK